MHNAFTLMLSLMQAHYTTLLNHALELAMQEQADDEDDQYWYAQDTYTPMVTSLATGDDEWDDYTWEAMSTDHTRPYWARTHAA